MAIRMVSEARWLKWVEGADARTARPEKSTIGGDDSQSVVWFLSGIFLRMIINSERV